MSGIKIIKQYKTNLYNKEIKEDIILLKKKNVGRLDPPDTKIWYKTLVINTALYWCKDRWIEQWNKIDS